MNLCELNYSFIENFDIFLRRQHNHKQNTAVKNVRCIKHIVSRAVMDGYLDSDPFAKYTVKREVVEKPFLTQEEIDRILAKDFHTPRLERVRDIFIFCCYTGLSYSDVLTLDRSHLSTDSKGRIWIKKRRVKTGVPFSVPLLPVPKLILDKYKGGDKLLPVIHISSCDEYLKEIAELCGIDKTVSFHTARYTFATTITISNRVSLEVVSKMLGHTTTRMSSHYAKIVDDFISEEMDMLEEKYK